MQLNSNPDTAVCKVYDFIHYTPACKTSTVVNSLKSSILSEGTIRVTISKLVKEKLVIYYKYNGKNLLFLNTLSKPLYQVNNIINKSISKKKYG